jgi:hypothetical protein
LFLFVLAIPVGCSGRNTRMAPDDAPTEVITARWLESPVTSATMRTERLAASSLADVLKSKIDHPPPDAKPKHILCLAAGGKYSAYYAGQIAGWTAHGTRPKFDIATGVSSGALVAAYAFLGEKYDARMTKFYTTVENKDLFKVRPLYYYVTSGAIASIEPLQNLIAKEVHDGVMDDLIAAHAEGRRLYIGTMDLHTRRLVIWDVTGIAASGRPDAECLVVKVLTTACSVPGMIAPMEFDVTVDGVHYTERHVDGGGVSQAFVRFPAEYAGVGPDGEPSLTGLAGSNMYVFSAGKLWADPVPSTINLFGKVKAVTSAALYALYRADLYRLYAKCVAGGMRFMMTALPQDFDISLGSMEIKPGEFKKMFDAGYLDAARGIQWRALPPGSEPGEEEMPRSGLNFRTVPPEPVVFPK